MEVKILCLLCLVLMFSVGYCFRLTNKNDIWERDLALLKSDFGRMETDFYDSPFLTGPEKFPIQFIDVDRNNLEEIEKEEERLSATEVDEETIRKAEKQADRDLLSGLNRILKNNETLKDVFKAENVYEFL